MIRHGSSYGLAVLICTLASGFLIAMLRTFLPEVLNVFSKISLFIRYSTSFTIPSKSSGADLNCRFDGWDMWGWPF